MLPGTEGVNILHAYQVEQGSDNGGDFFPQGFPVGIPQLIRLGK